MMLTWDNSRFQNLQDVVKQISKNLQYKSNQLLRYGDDYYEGDDIVFHDEVPEAVKGVIHPDKQDSVKVSFQNREKV